MTALSLVDNDKYNIYKLLCQQKNCVIYNQQFSAEVPKKIPRNITKFNKFYLTPTAN